MIQIFGFSGMTRTWRTGLTVGVLLASSAVIAPLALAQKSKLAAAAPVTYDNRYELYIGLNYLNSQAGQNLPTRFNLGGGEVLGTYWLNRRIGLGADFREDLGTTPVNPNQYFNGRALASYTTGMLGAQIRGPKTQFLALNAHAYGGVSAGNFTSSLTSGTQPAAYGLYSNRVKPVAVVGVSIDYNLSKKLAIRLQPDLVLEHYGTETREFVSVSAGVVYRFKKTIP